MRQHQADAIAAFLKRSRECIDDAEALLQTVLAEDNQAAAPPRPTSGNVVTIHGQQEKKD